MSKIEKKKIRHWLRASRELDGVVSFGEGEGVLAPRKDAVAV
jgi:hypothetical protein